MTKQSSTSEQATKQSVQRKATPTHTGSQQGMGIGPVQAAPAQLSMMMDDRVPAVQRQTMARNLGSTMGNRGLTQLVQRQAAGPMGPLSQTDRQNLMNQAIAGMGIAANNFTSACDDIRDAIKARIAAEAAAKGMVVDIAFGFLSPVLSAGVKSLANLVPAGSPDLVYRVALDALDGGWFTTGTMGMVTLGAKDRDKAAVNGTPGNFQGFLEWLELQYQTQLYGNAGQLAGLGDGHLAATALFWHPQNHSRAAYRDQVGVVMGHYEDQVMEQGIHTYSSGFGSSSTWTRVYGIRDDPNKQPIGAVVMSSLTLGGPSMITEYLTPDVGMQAVQNSIREWGDIPVVPQGRFRAGQNAGGPSYRLPGGTPTKNE